MIALLFFVFDKKSMPGQTTMGGMYDAAENPGSFTGNRRCCRCGSHSDDAQTHPGLSNHEQCGRYGKNGSGPYVG